MAKSNSFGHGQFIRLAIELLEHDAYIGLSKSAQLILIDFIGEWNRAEAAGGLVAGGLRYSYGMCRCDVSPPTFKAAMLELVAHGFIVRAAPSKRLRGAPHYYRASERWRSFNLKAIDGVIDFEDARRRITVVHTRRKTWAESQMELGLEQFRKGSHGA